MAVGGLCGESGSCVTHWPTEVKEITERLVRVITETLTLFRDVEARYDGKTWKHWDWRPFVGVNAERSDAT